MKITPKTEEQIHAESATRGPWQPGIYDAVIDSAIEKLSKAGNDMIELELSVFNASGDRRRMLDWLVDAMAFKVRHCAESAGVLPEYESGELTAFSLEGRSVRVKLGIDRSGNQPRNRIMDYVAQEEKKAANTVLRPPAKAVMTGSIDDDIPF